jgi:hypothetical protein
MDASQVEQGTQAWIDAKLGKVSASNLHKVLAKPKGRGQTESTTRRNYMSQLAIERVTGKSAEPKIQTWHMDRGIQLEPKARAEYEIRVSDMVLTAGFIEHVRIPNAGCSPDALVGDVGLAQFKCPILAIHYDYIKAAKIGKVPTDYYPQVQFEMACTGREWNDFVSYNEQYPPEKRLVIIRSERDDTYIKEIEAEVLQFNQEVEEMAADIRGEESDMTGILELSIKQVEQRKAR